MSFFIKRKGKMHCIIHIALILTFNLTIELLPRKSHWLKDWLAGRSRTNKGQNRCGIILISSPSLSTISCQHPLDFSANSNPLLSIANRFKGSLLSVSTACLTGDKDPPGIFQGAWKYPGSWNFPGAAKSSGPWKFPGPWGQLKKTPCIYKQDHQWWRYHRRLFDYQSPYF